MPTMTLLPDADGLAAVQWAAVGEGTRHDCLDDDNGDTSYVECSAPNRTMILGFSNSVIPESKIASIDSVQFLSSGRHTGRSGTADVDIAFSTPSGFSETVQYDSHTSSYETINGTVRTQKPDSSDWEFSDIAGLAMICTKNGSNEVRLSYLALEVTYTLAADNATFFGANF